MNHLITQEEATAKLQQACDNAGGVGAFAEQVGVTISAVSHQLHGSRPIQGKVAEHLGLRVHRETTIAYMRTEA